MKGKLHELALFAGGGGGILGGLLLGWETVAAVELDRYARRVLLARQRDGILPPFPIWDDVQTFDGRPWRGRVDILTAGFPCQDISIAGKGAGIDGRKSGLWAHVARLAGEVAPPFLYLENSPALLVRGMGRVLGDLASLGYNAEWGVFSAGALGAPHERKRIWIMASHPDRIRLEELHLFPRPSETGQPPRMAEEQRLGAGWESEPRVGRMGDGVAHRVDRLRALGNGQVPAVAATAWSRLSRNL
jgi:DNA (cytosine-5)-methyltransferase 1